MSGPKYVKNFTFSTRDGFTGSATDRKTVPVKGHERQKPRPRGMAMGGPVGYRTGGECDTAIRKHVRAPKPAGHGVKQK